MFNNIKNALIVIRQEEQYGGYNHSIVNKLVIITRFVL